MKLPDENYYLDMIKHRVLRDVMVEVKRRNTSQKINKFVSSAINLSATCIRLNNSIMAEDYQFAESLKKEHFREIIRVRYKKKEMEERSL